MKYIVWYEQTNSLPIVVEADNEEEARVFAEDKLNEKNFEDNIKKSDKGMFEFTYVDACD